MNCREFTSFLAEFVDGTLPAAQIAAFEAHIDDCPPCAVYLASYRTCVELGRTAFECGPDDALPESVPEPLIRAILAARKKS